MAIYGSAALTEIAGCFAFWSWLRQGQSVLWLLPGSVALAAFAPAAHANRCRIRDRAYAAYGGIYIAASLAWLWLVEGRQPDKWGLLGAAICVVGMGIILFGPRYE